MTKFLDINHKPRLKLHEKGERIDVIHFEQIKKDVKTLTDTAIKKKHQITKGQLETIKNSKNFFIF